MANPRWPPTARKEDLHRDWHFVAGPRAFEKILFDSAILGPIRKTDSRSACIRNDSCDTNRIREIPNTLAGILILIVLDGSIQVFPPIVRPPHGFVDKGAYQVEILILECFYKGLKETFCSVLCGRELVCSCTFAFLESQV